MNAPHSDASTQLHRLIEIGIALSAETDLDALLEKIVHHAREVTGADAGTLYLLSDGQLHFKVVQNASLGDFRGGATGRQLEFPPVPLDAANVSAYAAMSGRAVNVDDVYESEEFDFTGPRTYDRRTGYRSRSMLVVPMKGHEGSVIGVLQLINALEPESGAVVPFPTRIAGLAQALASQAAVAVTNARLIDETKRLFESLIKVLAVALDAKSPYTGNHVQRVALLNTALAQTISDAADGPFADVTFSRSQLEEIRIAGWLHDIGKVTTPVAVMDKATKLENVLDRIELVRARFGVIRRELKLEALSRKMGVLEKPIDARALARIDEELASRLEELDRDLDLIERCNQPSNVLDDEAVERLQATARRTYLLDGEETRCLTDEELRQLSVRKGTLTDEEMQIMRDHVLWTSRMLGEVPFTPPLRNVPTFAGQHHERLDGKGYPAGLAAADIPLQSRILAIADFYEALSAKDRPYKKPMPVETILTILRKSAEAGEIDGNILELMIREGLHERFEAEYEAARSQD